MFNALSEKLVTTGCCVSTELCYTMVVGEVWPDNSPQAKLSLTSPRKNTSSGIDDQSGVPVEVRSNRDGRQAVAAVTKQLCISPIMMSHHFVIEQSWLASSDLPLLCLIALTCVCRDTP